MNTKGNFYIVIEERDGESIYLPSEINKFPKYYGSFDRVEDAKEFIKSRIVKFYLYSFYSDLWNQEFNIWSPVDTFPYPNGKEFLTPIQEKEMGPTEVKNNLFQYRIENKSICSMDSNGLPQYRIIEVENYIFY